MYIDAKLTFDDDVAVTTDRAGTNTVDLGAITKPGLAKDMYVNVMITTAFTTSGNTLTAVLCETEDGANPASGAEGIVTVIDAVAASALTTQGTLYRVKVPERLSGAHNTLAMYYDVSAALAGGAVTAWISWGVDEKIPA